MLALPESSSYMDEARRHTASHLDAKGNGTAVAGSGINASTTPGPTADS